MTTRESIPRLSKSRFMAGLQCHKRLWLALFQPELADEIGDAQQAIFDQGTQVGELARGYIPGGVLIDEAHTEHDAAMAHTKRVLTDGDVPALYEAAFRHEDVRTRVDILQRNGDGSFDLIEVKSSSEVKPPFIWDVAIQVWVVLGAGIRLRRYGLLHIDTSYVYPGGAHDLQELFALADLTDEVAPMLAQVPALLAAMREPLWQMTEPEIPIGDHCFDPYDCPFIGHCHPPGPEHPVTDLYRARRPLLDELGAAGIETVDAIPEGYPGLSEMNRRIREAVVNGEPFHDPAIGEVLRELGRPLYFMDFESFNPAIPRYPGTRPYQQIPFQWSAHRLDGDGTVTHAEFLHTDLEDPRPAFMQSLLACLGERGPVCVYSHFEKTQLGGIRTAYPEYAEGIAGILDQLVDLLPLVREHVYHPEFHGSFSIKSVLPALVPDAGYDDLAISDGGSASAAYATLTDPSTPDNTRQELIADLRRYCERDTEAMVRLYQRLVEDKSSGPAR